MAEARTDRQRRYRQRQARRLRVYQIEVPDRVIETMLNSGRIRSDQARDVAQLQVEMTAIIEEWAGLHRR